MKKITKLGLNGHTDFRLNQLIRKKHEKLYLSLRKYKEYQRKMEKHIIDKPV